MAPVGPPASPVGPNRRISGAGVTGLELELHPVPAARIITTQPVPSKPIREESIVSLQTVYRANTRENAAPQRSRAGGTAFLVAEQRCAHCHDVTISMTIRRGLVLAFRDTHRRHRPETWVNWPRTGSRRVIAHEFAVWRGGTSVALRGGHAKTLASCMAITRSPATRSDRGARVRHRVGHGVLGAQGRPLVDVEREPAGPRRRVRGLVPGRHRACA